MSTYVKLAWRNIWRKRRRTMITVSAIVFAVILAIVMQSINRGSYEAMIDRLVRFDTGHLQVQDYRYDAESSLDNTFPFGAETREKVLADDARIAHIAPRIQAFMLAANGGITRGAIVTGLDLEKEDRFNGFRGHLAEGRFFEPGESAVVLGRGMAKRLVLGVGDTLVLIGQGRFGMSASGLFEITGLIHHPIRDLDTQAVYMPLETAQNLFSAEGHLSALLISLDRERQTERVAASLRRALDGTDLTVYTWPERMPELLELMELDLIGPRFITVILYIVIGFGFLGTVLTMTLERMREFAVLVSIGMRRGQLAAVVLIETLFIGVIGVLTGMACAWVILWWIHPIRVSGTAAQALLDYGFEPYLPMSFAPDQFFIQGFFVFLIAMAIFLFPWIKIFRLNVCAATRN